jgi:tRNA wybutosine-synthesizing protein 3
MHDFDRSKEEILRRLQSSGCDLSPKGAVDELILPCLELINSHKDYVTTSTCSGRIAVFADVKGAGRWLLCSHEPVDSSSLVELLSDAASRTNVGQALFKLEPAILHVEARDVSSASALVTLARDVGYRESGLSVGSKGRVMVGLRTRSPSLDAPLISEGAVIVSPEYVECLVRTANEGLAANEAKLMKLQQQLKVLCQAPDQANGAKLVKLHQELKIRGQVQEQQQHPNQLPGSWLTWEELPEHPRCRSSPLRRWGHCAVRVTMLDSDQHILALFGYGEDSREGKSMSRRSDVLRMAVRQSLYDTWEPLCTVPSAGPAAREMAAVVAWQRGMVVIFGGRASPLSPFGDLWYLTALGPASGSWMWMRCEATGSLPLPRWGHSFHMIGTDRAILVGGRDSSHVFSDLHVLTRSEKMDGWTFKWDRLSTMLPRPLFFHAAASLDSNITLLFGGLHDLTDEHGSSLVWSVSVEAGMMTATITQQPSLPGEGGWFGHGAAASLKHNLIVLTGGCTGSSGADYALARLERQSSKTANLLWMHVSSCTVTRYVAPHTCLLYLTDEDTFLRVGGGTHVGAFSPLFAPCCKANVGRRDPGAPKVPDARKTWVIVSNVCIGVQNALEKMGIFNSESCDVTTYSSTSIALSLLDGAPSASTLLEMLRDNALVGPLLATGEVSLLENLEDLPNERTRSVQNAKKCLIVPKFGAKKVKVVLEHMGIFDRMSGITPFSTTAVAVPLLDSAASASILETLRENPEVGPFVACGEVTLADQPLRAPAPRPKGARQRNDGLRNHLISLLVSGGIPSDAADGIVSASLPNKLETLSDVCFIPEGSFEGAQWVAAGLPSVYEAIAVAAGAQRVASRGTVLPNDMRQPQARMLWPVAYSSDGSPTLGPGGAGWVVVKENGIAQGFDLTRVMFCKGNGTEKSRVGRLDCTSETVVDLYCGIGYYTLPYLVHAKAWFVHACELNPDSVECLRHNLAAAGVLSRCMVHPGDNRVTAPRLGRIAHRVNLGLLPSSEDGWPVACQVLRDEGGWCHVHGLCRADEKGSWGNEIAACFQDLLASQGRKGWQALCRGVVKVKSYAPHILHCVADVECRPTT